VAVIVPVEQFVMIGQDVVVDGRQSTSGDDDEALTYQWSLLSTPVGSSAAALLIHDTTDGASVTLRPDVLGPYTVQLIVSTSSRSSEPVTATAYVQATLVPYTSRVIPDGKFPFKVLGDFWNLIDDKAAFPILWSGQTQLMASDLLRLFQYEYGRSINNIQPWFRRRWLSYAPKLPIEGAAATYVLGNHQAGTAAFTPSTVVAAVGTVVSEFEFVILEGSPAFSAVGEQLEVLTTGGSPGNVGLYTVSAVNSSGDGFILSAATPFPSPTDEVLASGADVATGAASDAVESAAVDFSAAGVVVGDLFRLETGDERGYRRITGVGVADGLPNNRTLQLEAVSNYSQAGLSFTVLKALVSRYGVEAVPLTDTVYVPEADADFSAFQRTTLSGSGAVLGAYEVQVESRHVFDALVGKTITLTSGNDTGRTVSIVAVSRSRTGYVVGSPLTAPYGNAGYSIPVVTDISARLLILEGQAYRLLSTRLDADRPSVAAGGTGPVWVLTLERPLAPSGRSGLSWRVGATLISDEVEDFELEGICAGDTLIFEVSRTDASISAEIPCQVLGARGNMLAFDWGVAVPVDGATSAFTERDVLPLVEGLHLSYGYVDDADVVQLTGAAADLFAAIPEFTFQQQYSNLELTADTRLTVAGHSFRAKASRIVRNSKIPVTDDLTSVPALFEYIKDPEGDTRADGSYVYAAADGNHVELPRAPVSLLEGRDYFISGSKETAGSEGVTEAGSDVIEVQDGDLLVRGVVAGDILELLTGADAGRYVILNVLAADRVRVMGVDGDLPSVDGAAIEYLVDRRVDARFLFLVTSYAPSTPAPESLWAETSFFDAAEYIEDNFGAMVGVTRGQLDEFGSSQVSYLGAVKGLMYAWATGPTVDALTIGTHILAGLPVTESRGLIKQIDPNYGEDFGRILVEDLTDENIPKGFTRVYFYKPSGSTSPEFAGLALNPVTGAEYRVNDIVEDIRPLTRGAAVRDYINAPLWWSPGPGEGELQKYHTWQIAVDATQIDSRDVPLIQSFATAIREVETVPRVLLELGLVDTVTVTDDLFLEVGLYAFDDPAFSLESTHITDDYNGGSLPLRRFGWGSFMSRTFWEGYDLVQSAGSNTVTSARGGFTAGLAGPINPKFTGVPATGSTAMVRVGDILFVSTGPNRGRYSVTAVNSNTELEIAQITPAKPPASLPTADFSASSGDRFYVERLAENPLVAGADLATDGTTVVLSAGATFVSDGVTTDDVLILRSGADKGRYRILEVLGNTSLELDAAPVAVAAGITFDVERYALLVNPIVTSAGDTTAGSRHITSLTDFDLEGVLLGDELTALTGTDAGLVFRVLDVPSATELVVSKPFTASEVGVNFEINRQGFGSIPDSDWTFEALDPWDEVHMVIYHPRTPLGGGPFTTATFTAGAPATITFAVDVAAAGATAAMVVEVQAGDNVGVYEISSVVTTVVTLDGVESFPTPGVGVVSADFLSESADFDVLNDTVTENTGANLEFVATSATALAGAIATVVGAVVTGAGTAFESEVQAGQLFKIDADGVLAWTRVLKVDSNTQLTLVETYRGASAAGAASVSDYLGGIVQGDKFEFSGGTFVVELVVADVVTLTADTGVTPVAAHTGKFLRSRLP